MLFAPAPELISTLPFAPHFQHHGVYANFGSLPSDSMSRRIASPSRMVKQLAASWQAAYGLDLKRLIVLVYRGTDKDTEVRLAPIEDYVKVARHLRRADPSLQVAIQTDQAEALEVVLAEIPDAIYLRELPVTTGKTVIHNLPVHDQFGITRPELAARLLAMTFLYSGARYLVSHSGNIGLWLALYRGYPDGFYQFYQDGGLRDLSGAKMKLEAL